MVDMESKRIRPRGFPFKTHRSAFSSVFSSLSRKLAGNPPGGGSCLELLDLCRVYGMLTMTSTEAQFFSGTLHEERVYRPHG